MTALAHNPFLKLNRFVLTKAGKHVYDQNFHEGVNIIRGDNGTGKSTIANAIFYILGGEFTQWLPEVLECDFAIAEISINDNLLTFKREISDTPQRPLDIYYGTIEKALKSTIEGWTRYAYRKSSKKSFSQVVFEYLGLPSISSDEDDTITLNQLLRLIYVDQMSSFDSIFKHEEFDKSIVRETIANLLLGTYDDGIYRLEIKLKEERKNLSETKSEISAIKTVFSYSNEKLNRKRIDKEINDIESQLNKIEGTLSSEKEDKIKPSEVTKKQIELRHKLVEAKESYDSLFARSIGLEEEITDSLYFIATLETRKKSLKESILTRDVLGQITLTNCPKCLQPLEKKADDSKCNLCKQDISEEKKNSQILRMEQELDNQINESIYLKELREKEKNQLDNRLPLLRSEVNRRQKSLDQFLSESGSSSNQIFNQLREKRGILLGKLDKTKTQLQSIIMYENLIDKRIEIEKNILGLEESLKLKKEEQREKGKKAYKLIEEIGLYFLHKDAVEDDGVPYEQSFKKAKVLDINFTRDTFSIDRRYHFSASSMVLFKNAVRFAIFFSSLKLSFMRYPRFILCDNMEDKGMKPKRSHKFQTLVTHFSDQKLKESRHQIIFTTSMIAPELDKKEYCVGPDYSPSQKTLDL